MKKWLAYPLLLCCMTASAQDVRDAAAKLQDQVVKWRRHFHQHPELSNREFATAKYVANYLKKLGLEVKTGVAHTGVVAVLDSGNPGPTVALRADMDALPVKEMNELPFRSQAMGGYNGKSVPVMHACGHDTHIAMLMGAATILSENKSSLQGKVKFVFQPAEEGVPAGERGGAELMVEQGVMQGVDVVFGLHISSDLDVGSVEYRDGGIMAGVDPFKIVIKGKQSHGAYPWQSVDPIVTSAQVIMGLQTIVSREIKLLDNAAVVTVGSIHGGVRSNIIPDKVEMLGTIRTLNPVARNKVYQSLPNKVEHIAASMGAEAEVTLPLEQSYPITYNDPALMSKMLPTLKRTAGEEHTLYTQAVTGAEDFSFFQQQVPGLYLFVGGKALDMPREKAPDHHTPYFVIDESGMQLGVELLTNLTLDYMKSAKH
ncbi:amidohydrolase [Neptunicella marina]|uniref:Amidohydrolase n=2 Tax=Neptunicella marina TaxID=2125989 RepID=A0A8J6IXE6_9ALTE|nr:amidohydrolase [Neptunicella marina]